MVGRDDHRRACPFYDMLGRSCPARIAIDGSCAISQKTVSATAARWCREVRRQRSSAAINALRWAASGSRPKPAWMLSAR